MFKFKKAQKFIFFLFLTFQCKSFASKRCEMLFEGLNSKKDASVLHERDGSLHTSFLVERSAKVYTSKNDLSLKSPSDKIKYWLDTLEKISTKSRSSARTLSAIKSILSDHFVIKADEIPESYFELQQQIEFERGLGKNPLTELKRMELAELVKTDQRTSLEGWIDFLVSPEMSKYPTWIKYWILTGVTKLSKYNPETASFGLRSKETIAPFPELNHQAIDLIIQHVLKKVDEAEANPIIISDFNKVLGGMNFGKIYGSILYRLGFSGTGFKTNQGEWVHFPQKSDYKMLVNRILGKNTGWCIANAGTARSKIADGDFYVYFSLDNNYEATVPRVAIRMKGTGPNAEIGEIRGVGSNQNFDLQLSQTDIVEKKIKQFGVNGDLYLKRDRDMKMLTSVYNKHKTGLSFSNEDIGFIWELGSKIHGFGQKEDPRISEIRRGRSINEDLSQFKYSVDENVFKKIDIVYSKFEAGVILTSKEIRFLWELDSSQVGFGNIVDRRVTELRNKPEVIESLIKELESQYSREEISTTKEEFLNRKAKVHIGDLSFPELVKLEGDFSLPELMLGKLSFENLEQLDTLTLPNTVRGDIIFPKLVSLKKLVFPKKHHGIISMGQLKTGEGVIFPTELYGSLFLHSLQNAKDIKFPVMIKGSLHLASLNSAEGLILPKSIDGVLGLTNLLSVEGLNLSGSSIGVLELYAIKEADGLTIHEKINSVAFFRIATAKGIKFPTVLNGNLTFGDSFLTSEGLALPEVIQGTLSIPKLKKLENVKLPAFVGKLNSD